MTITIETVLDAIIRSDQAALETEGPTYHVSDFRTWPPRFDYDDGEPVLVTVFETLIGGRWEGAVSTQRIPQNVRTELGI